MSRYAWDLESGGLLNKVWKRQLGESRCITRSLVSKTCQGPGRPGVFAPGINGTWRVGGADAREAAGSVWSG